MPPVPPGPAGRRPHLPAHRAVRRAHRPRAPAGGRPGPAPPRRACCATSPVGRSPTAEERARADAVLELVGLTGRGRRPRPVAAAGPGPAGRAGPGPGVRAAPAVPRRAVLGPRRPRDRGHGRRCSSRSRPSARLAILLCEHDVPVRRAAGGADLRARLRAADRRGRDRRGAGRPGRARRLPGDRMSDPVEATTQPPGRPTPPPPTGRAGARARRRLRRATTSSGPCSASRFDVGPGPGGRADRPERRGQDHRWPGWRRVWSRPTAGTRAWSAARTSPAARPTTSPGPASPTPRRVARCSPRCRWRRTSRCPSAGSSGARGQAASARAGLRAVPPAGRAAPPGGRARCRAASSACSPWPGCWCSSPSCSSPTSSPSAWRRSSPTRSTSVLRRILASGTALLVIEQQVDHALALADHVIVLERGRIVSSGPPDRSTRPPSRSADPCRRRRVRRRTVTDTRRSLG